MTVPKQIFHEVGPKTKSRRKVVHDIKKVEKHCARTFLSLDPLSDDIANLTLCLLYGGAVMKIFLI